jgi:hypothetical protein
MFQTPKAGRSLSLTTTHSTILRNILAQVTNGIVSAATLSATHGTGKKICATCASIGSAAPHVEAGDTGLLIALCVDASVLIALRVHASVLIASRLASIMAGLLVALRLASIESRVTSVDTRMRLECRRGRGSLRPEPNVEVELVNRLRACC